MTVVLPGLPEMVRVFRHIYSDAFNALRGPDRSGNNDHGKSGIITQFSQVVLVRLVANRSVSPHILHALD
ncbi:MAG: hypothetical protein QM488_17480 [Rhizobiaceae bacterium]